MKNFKNFVKLFEKFIIEVGKKILHYKKILKRFLKRLKALWTILEIFDKILKKLKKFIWWCCQFTKHIALLNYFYKVN